MASLKEYLSTLVEAFRRDYDTLSKEEKNAVQLNLTFAEPCQIEFFSFENDGQLMIVTLESNRPDALTIHEHVKAPFSSTITRRLADLGIPRYWIKRLEKRKGISDGTWQSLSKDSSAYSFADLQKTYPSPDFYAKVRFRDVKRLAQDNLRSRMRSGEYKAIEREVEIIKASMKKIEDAKLREKMLEVTGKIDKSISTIKKLEHYEKRLDKIEQEIGGVRTMIGATKEFQDFRVLTTDLEDLKKSHIHKDVVTTEIKRLDEKIDKTLENLKTRMEALNTRIEDLKAIKFWSKRTLLEIALAILATLTTLYAVGIIKF